MRYVSNTEVKKRIEKLPDSTEKNNLLSLVNAALEIEAEQTELWQRACQIEETFEDVCTHPESEIRQEWFNEPRMKSFRIQREQCTLCGKTLRERHEDSQWGEWS